MPCMFVLSTMTSLRQTEGACFFMTFVIPQWEKKKKSCEAAVYPLEYVSCKIFYVAHFNATVVTPLCTLLKVRSDLFLTRV